MKAFKGFTKNLWSRLGNGQEESCSFSIGETKEVPESKTVRNGFHCCENPFECLTYYAMDGKNRFFRVEAAGDIDEDESERIACTKITLLEELTPKAFALEGMKYIIEHPDRANWEQNHGTVVVKKNEAEAKGQKSIAIARGSSPRVKGPEGSILGLIVEDEEGIKNAKLLICTGATADKWLRLTEEREVKVIEESED
jgi:hypothetical protein